jgi:hypothetical protein
MERRGMDAGATPSRHWALTTSSGFDEFYRSAAEMMES